MVERLYRLWSVSNDIRMVEEVDLLSSGSQTGSVRLVREGIAHIALRAMFERGGFFS
jgi:hypothetical protein